jgi:hypothetical protein
MIDTITRDRLKEIRLTGMVECLDQLTMNRLAFQPGFYEPAESWLVSSRPA